ncbi:unnamed protein product [Moneuplotes crassus]|uniref:Uncharacterized protein n=2 Tax=Euplotes crassus TaxID=5936 RepID=A0AAD1XZ20_EUPCR|nr:unnamed protein product [Moneuplotes crassus]
MSKNNPDIPEDDRSELQDPKKSPPDSQKSNRDSTSKPHANPSTQPSPPEESKKKQSPLTPKPPPKKKKKSQKAPEGLEIVEELQRDLVVRDETIKELNLKVVEVQAQLKDALMKAEKSGNVKRDYKIAHMEDDLRHAKNDLVINSQQIEKFMEEGTKTVNQYIEKYEKAEGQIGQLKDELAIKQNLLKNKDEVYRRVIADLQEARKNIGILQVQNVKLENKNTKLLQKIEDLKDEKILLEDRLIELDSTSAKIKKQNMLVEEFNSKYYGISISEIGNEINKQMFELMVKLRKNHLYNLIKNGKDLRFLLEEEGRGDLITKLSKFHDLKDFEPENSKEQKSVKKENKPKDQNKDLKEGKKNGPKVIRKGGGFVLEKDDEDTKKKDKSNSKKAAFKSKNLKDSMSTKEWTEFVWKAKKNNPVLKRLMNISKYHKKDKNGLFKKQADLAEILTKGINLTKKNSFFGKVFKSFKRKPNDENLIKENKKLSERMDTYSKLLTMSVSEIIKYVSEAKEGIEKIEQKYSGFFSLKDPLVIERITEKKEAKEEMDPLVKLKHKEREVDELRDQLNHIKIQITDVENDYEKCSQKQLMYKTKLDLSKQDADEVKREYEVRIHDYKQALYEKDEETTKLHEAIKNMEKEIRTKETAKSGSSYELESTKKKLNEARHHQDMLTKKVQEYEEVVRVINTNLKKNNSESSEASTVSKHKLKEIEKMKIRFKVLEDELHKREDAILKLKSILAKNSKDLKHKDEEINKMLTRRMNKVENVESEQKREYEAQIEVLKEMIVGLKSQIKAKEMDGYRLESKVVSLQSQIDTIKNQEKKLNSMLRSSKPLASEYSPAIQNTKLKASTNRVRASRESTRSKPLIKSTPKVKNPANKSMYEDISNEYGSPLKQSIKNKKTSSKLQSSKPDILVSSKAKSIVGDSD